MDERDQSTTMGASRRSVASRPIASEALIQQKLKQNSDEILQVDKKLRLDEANVEQADCWFGEMVKERLTSDEKTYSTAST